MISDREPGSAPTVLESGVPFKLPMPAQRGGQPTIQSRLIDPIISGEEWDRLLAKHPDAQSFHCAAWARVLAQTYDHKPFYFVATQKGEAVALLPLMEVRSRLNGIRGVSLPFSDFCPPLLFEDEGSEALAAAAIELGRSRGWKHLELRGRMGSVTLESDSPSYYGHTLDLRLSENGLFEGCASSLQRALRKARRQGTVVEIGSTRRDVEAFYDLHCQTRRKHGLPPQPWRFFESIHAEILQPGNGCVVVAKQNGKAIAAAVFFRLGRHALYKFGASNAKAGEVRANHLVLWEGIKFSARSGAQFLHFGRTDLDHEGLRRFKRSWGAIEHPIQYLRFDFRQERWIVAASRSRGSYRQIFRYLPVSVNRIAGAMIYPHLD